MSKFKIEYKEARMSSNFFWYVYENLWYGWIFRELFHTEQEARNYIERKKQPPKVIYID